MTTQYIYDLVDTWNASGTTFTAIKMDVTDTASNAASRLIDLQVGGTSKFVVDKVGRIRGDNSTSVQAYISFDSTAGGGPIIGNVATGLVTFAIPFGYIGVHLCSTAPFGFVSTANASSGTLDTILTRRAAANLRLGAADAAAPVAQTLSVQSVVAGTSNTAGANLTITGSQGTGTGAGGSIIFQVAPAGGAGTAQNALATALTINSARLTTAEYGLAVSNTGATSGANLYKSGGILYLDNGGGGTVINSAGGPVYTKDAFVIGFGGAGNTFLYSDAANTLALRNGTAAQAFNIYNTYTSSTSFERYSVDWITTANLVIVGPNKGSGGGTQRVQRLSYLEDGGAGSTVPLLGSTCPAASGTVKSWIKVITSDGTTAYVPCWA